MAARNKIEVKIAGKEYTLVGTETDEYMQKIALYVDKKVSEITRANNKLSTNAAAVLTALNVADEYYKVHMSETQLREELKRIREELEQARNENSRLTEENIAISKKNVEMQLELVKKDGELSEIRVARDKSYR